MQPPSSALGDADAYRAIFFEETQEHLATVESILLRLAPGQHRPGELNEIFRAVHSIKGSAAMLGCDDMAALAHLQESLLDLLRKEERALERGDIDALLQAGDTLQAQALRHRGALDRAPDARPVEALLRTQLDRPRTGAQAGAAGPVQRRFAVRLGPLAETIAQAELDMMLGGLGEMGSVSGTRIDNRPGGEVAFDVRIEGTAMDLRSVLTLLVAPALVTIDAQTDAPEPAAPTLVSDDDAEFFVDPGEFRRRREAASLPARDVALHDAVLTQPIVPVVAAEQVVLSNPDTGYIRVATEKIDLLVNLVGELVITEAMLSRLAEQQGEDGGLADLARHTRNLQEAVMAIRMLPIANVFSRFTRLAHELSLRLGKQVQLRIDGEATELDRGLIEKISDPLTHLVRNAIDHGLETPEARLAAGKPAMGTVWLRATQRGGSVVIEVSDDGRGLDRGRILSQAMLQGIVLPPDVADSEVWPLIFEAGLSTATQVTELSGRGVGMDVVRRNIQSLGGAIELDSAPGRGTTVTVSVPLTLAIVDAMIVAIGGERYVLPLATVAESMRIESGQVHAMPGGGEALRVRDDYLPLIHLAKVFPPQQPPAQAGGIAVVVESEGGFAALVVDELVGQQQVVVKSLEANFRKVPGLSAATVMADGSVALILDVSHLVRHGGRGAP